MRILDANKYMGSGDKQIETATCKVLLVFASKIILSTCSTS
jgi:hypothetical protein